MNRGLKKRFFAMGVFLIAVGLFPRALPAFAEMSPAEMLQKSDEARGNTDGIQWDISMDALEEGRAQHREMQVTARGYNCLIETLAPANVKGQKMLMLDRNMWFAKPGLSKAVPISPRQKLMGTAANGDIASTNYSGDYNIAGTAEETVDNDPCLVFDLQAVDNRATYDRIRYWVSKKRLVGIRAEFYTVSGKMLKTAAFAYDNRISLDGRPREFISRMTITSAVIQDDVTTITYNQPVIRKVADAVFNLNLLTR
jgi:outer membrane lipoprotein-sorting protein